MERSKHDNTLVVRWITNHHGLPLDSSPPPHTFFASVPGDELCAEVRTVMLEWGAEILDGRYTITHRWAQPFTVLSYCRMLHSLEIRGVASKREGAAWGKTHLPDEWHALIDRAEADRPYANALEPPPDPQDVMETLEFVRFTISKLPGV